MSPNVNPTEPCFQGPTDSCWKVEGLTYCFGQLGCQNWGFFK